MRRHGWGAPAVAAAAVVVLLAGVALVVVSRSDRSTVLTEQAAVDAFRDEAGVAEPAAPPPPAASSPAPSAVAPPAAVPTAAPPGPASPAASTAPRRTVAAPAPAARPTAAAQRREVPVGVYSYATDGYEEVDALGGARHDYPAATTVTYTREGCGTRERWQPLEERIGSALQCAGPGGTELRSSFQQREFFGQKQDKTYRCDPGVPVLPRDPRPGQSWQGRCSSGDSELALAGRVVALEQLDVGGTAVRVARVRLEGTVTGSVRGRTDREVWLSLADGLLVQATADTDTLADTAGGTVRYREQYRLRLTSLQPRR